MKITRVIKTFILKYNLNLIFMISLIGIFTSLYFEHILNLPVCDLCWIERIFFYPVSLISLIGLLLKDRNVSWYILTFSVINAPITLYHHFLKINPFFQNTIDLCTNKINSCSNLEWELIKNSNITIPLLAFIATIFIILLSIIHIKTSQLNKK